MRDVCGEPLELGFFKKMVDDSPHVSKFVVLTFQISRSCRSLAQIYSDRKAVLFSGSKTHLAML